MKIRIGFVSNSSSSSFVVFGIKVNRDLFKDEIDSCDDDLNWFFYKQGLKGCYAESREENTLYFGKVFEMADDDYNYHEGVITETIEKAKKNLKKVKEKFPKVEGEEIKLYCVPPDPF